VAILLDEATRVCVIGITGTQSRHDLGINLAFGTRIVCGVAPGRGGTELHGVPVFNNCLDAMSAVGFDAAVAYLPPAAYVDAMDDVVRAGPQWVHVVTDGVALHDNVLVRQRATDAGVRINGPNTNGIVSAGRAKVGMLGHEPGVFERGSVGVLSKSGGYSNDLAYVLSAAGLGVTTVIPIGGDPVVGSTFADLLPLFERDPETKAVAIYSEPGPCLELDVAALLDAGGFTKPLVALVCGDFLDDYDDGLTFGHAGAFLAGPETHPAAKRALLADAGVTVVERTADIPAVLPSLLTR
jgi:succinyl-CoA synthetase alpha subunit